MRDIRLRSRQARFKLGVIQFKQGGGLIDELTAPNIQLLEHAGRRGGDVQVFAINIAMNDFRLRRTPHQDHRREDYI